MPRGNGTPPKLKDEVLRLRARGMSPMAIADALGVRPEYVRATLARAQGYMTPAKRAATERRRRAAEQTVAALIEAQRQMSEAAALAMVAERIERLRAEIDDIRFAMERDATVKATVTGHRHRHVEARRAARTVPKPAAEPRRTEPRHSRAEPAPVRPPRPTPEPAPRPTTAPPPPAPKPPPPPTVGPGHQYAVIHMPPLRIRNRTPEQEPAGCRYIIGDPRDDDWRYCQRDQITSSPYCQTHHDLCRDPPNRTEPAPMAPTNGWGRTGGKR